MQNIAGQCFAFTLQENFTSHNLNFYLKGEGEGDGIKSRLPFKIFSTLLMLFLQLLFDHKEIK